MKYKIQTKSLWGWADLKTSMNGKDYEVETFHTEKDAEDEMNMIIDNLEGSSEDEYRIVSANTKQDIDLYS